MKTIPPEIADRKSAKIHESILTIDSHADTPLLLARSSNDLGRRNRPDSRGGKVDFIRMKEGGLDAIFMAAYVEQQERTPSGYAIGTDLSLIRDYFSRGVRYITLCHMKNNDICDSVNDSTEHGGLSDFGKDVVREMNRVGMMIDVSHISDQAFFDILKISRVPIIASHSGARAVCDNPRNLNDAMLKALAKNGVVVQINFYTEYVKMLEPYAERDSALKIYKEKYPNVGALPPEEREKAFDERNAIDIQFPPRLASVSDLVDHIDHVVKVAGIDHVGIGTDFDGGGGLRDCFDGSQMGNVTRELVRRGYSKKDIEKIWSGNLMRVWKKVLSAAE
ncbi:MAG: dipeptidase [Candidatus Neomarinimicrobiota bacterium]